MSRRRIMFALGLAASLGATGARADVGAPAVVVSIKPIHSLVAAVMEGIDTPDLILDGATSPHTHALKPSQTQRLANADVVFWVGPNLEGWLIKPVETVAAKATSVALIEATGVEVLDYRTDSDIEKQHGHDEHADEHGHGDHAEHDDHASHDEHTDEDGHAGHDGHDHGTIDAHVWLDPVNAQAIVRTVAATLSAADPVHAQDYAGNAERAVADIDTLITDIEARIAPARGRPFVVFHDAYQYFEKRFRLRTAGVIAVSEDIRPGAERIAGLRARVRNLGAVCVFAEPQFDPKLVDVVVEGTPAKTGVLDPLASAHEPGPALYGDLLRSIADTIAGCLGGVG